MLETFGQWPQWWNSCKRRTVQKRATASSRGLRGINHPSLHLIFHDLCHCSRLCALRYVTGRSKPYSHLVLHSISYDWHRVAPKPGPATKHSVSNVTPGETTTKGTKLVRVFSSEFLSFPHLVSSRSTMRSSILRVSESSAGRYAAISCGWSISLAE